MHIILLTLLFHFTATEVIDHDMEIFITNDDNKENSFLVGI